MPGKSIYTYGAKGGLSGADSGWIASKSGTNKSTAEGKAEDTVSVLWDAGPVIGGPVYKAAPGFTWKLDVNVVEIKLDNLSLTAANSAGVGTMCKGMESEAVATTSATTGAAMTAKAKVTFTGPTVDGKQRGVRYMQGGFLQISTSRDDFNMLAHSGSTMKTLRITHLLENDTRYLDQINVDCDGKPLTSEWPWYNATGDGAFFHGTNELASVSEEWEIQDTPWVSLANGQFSAETINDWLPTETNIRWNFELNIAARTRDNHVRSDEKDNFTEFAQGTWRWDGDAKHAAGKWAANDAEVSILAPLAASKDAGKLVEDWSLKDGDKSHQPFNKYIHPWSKFNEHDLEIL